MGKMKAAQFLVFAGVSLLSLNGGGAQELQTTQPKPAPVTHTARRVNCRKEMNVTRREVGLPDFTEPQEVDKLPIVGQENESKSGSRNEGSALSVRTRGSTDDPSDAEKQQAFLKSACNALLRTFVKNENSPSKDKQAMGTYMYAPQGAEQEDCAAAVEYWKGAIDCFPGLPPACPESQGIYDDHRKISLVGLFNTRHNPTVDCALVTCQPGATFDQEEEEVDDEEEEGGKDDDDDEDLEEEGTVGEVEGPGGGGGGDLGGGVGGGGGLGGGLGVGRVAGNDGQDHEDGDDRGDSFNEVASPVNLSKAERTTDQLKEKAPAFSRPQGRRLTVEEAPTYGLVCLSRPQTLLGTQPPFTEELWDKITGAENSTAPPKVFFAVSASAAAALVQSLF
ncbi:hypothetical protein ACSSS7_003873 [Eimeria intestinalis]